MNGLAKMASVTALMVGVLTMAASANASVTALSGTRYSDSGHDCDYYLKREMPAPKRCYHYFYEVIGPDVYMHGNLVFQDREAFRQFIGGSPAEGSAEREDGVRGSESSEHQGGDYDHSGSGGASRGADAKPASGGASNGGHIPPHLSGGASGS